MKVCKMLTPQCQSSTDKADAVSTPLPHPEPLGGSGGTFLAHQPHLLDYPGGADFLGMLGRFDEDILE